MDTDLNEITTSDKECCPAINPRRKQHFLALLANLTAVCTGIALGWSSPALPILQHETNLSLSLHLTTEQGSWVSALVPLGAIFGALPVGILADNLGRKTVLLALAAPFLLGWLFILFAKDKVWLIYVGRFISGLSAGATTVLVPLYCEEIAEVSLRGAVGAYLDFMICIGVLCIYILGAFIPYYWFTASGCILPVVFVLTFVWMPESPVFLASKGYIEKAKNVLIWLRDGSENSIQTELDSILEYVDDKANSVLEQCTPILNSRNLFHSPTFKALFIVLGLMLIQQIAGISAVVSYTVQIFNEAGSNFSGEVSTIIVGSAQALAVFFSSTTVDHVGRRFLLLLSTSSVALCLLCLSLYSYFKTHDYNIDSWTWIPLVSLILYVICFALGIGPIPWFMMAELLPAHTKGWASAVGASFNWTIAWLVTKEFPLMLYNMGEFVTYAILCIFCVVGTLFIAIFVPETKDKTMLEIQQALGYNRP